MTKLKTNSWKLGWGLRANISAHKSPIMHWAGKQNRFPLPRKCSKNKEFREPIEYFDFPNNLFIQGFLFIYPRFVLLYDQYRSLYNKYKPWMNK